jgi:hypothetical protein
MKKEHWARIHEDLVVACTALFEANGVALAVEEAAGVVTPPGAAIASFIGFSGEQLLGNLTLVTPSAVVCRSYPLRDRWEIDDAAQCDWACELVNQLLGRLKIRLLAWHLVIQPSTPSAAFGLHLRAHEAPREGFRSLKFRAGSEQVCVLFDGVATATTTIAPGPPDVEGRPVEGDLLFF